MELTRRKLLGAAGSGAVLALAGCSCRKTSGMELDISIDDVESQGEQWAFDLTVTASFFGIDDNESIGIGDWELAAYDADNSVLETEAMGAVRWEDIPDENRDENDCGSNGTVSRDQQLTAETVPATIGPRFTESRDVKMFDNPRTESGILALRHTDASFVSLDQNSDGPPGDGSERTDATNETTEENSDDETNQAENGVVETEDWPPEEVAADTYQQITVHSLPWPEPERITAASNDDVVGLEFVVDNACSESRGGVEASRESNEFRASWQRETEQSCDRPVLQDVAVEQEALVLRVGQQHVEHAYCRPCGYLGYEASGEIHWSVETEVEKIVIEHVTDDGALEERVVEDVGESPE